MIAIALGSDSSIILNARRNLERAKDFDIDTKPDSLLESRLGYSPEAR
jgi:hypothetical protein